MGKISVHTGGGTTGGGGNVVFEKRYSFSGGSPYNATAIVYDNTPLFENQRLDFSNIIIDIVGTADISCPSGGNAYFPTLALCVGGYEIGNVDGNAFDIFQIGLAAGPSYSETVSLNQKIRLSVDESVYPTQYKDKRRLNIFDQHNPQSKNCICVNPDSLPIRIGWYCAGRGNQDGRFTVNATVKVTTV